MGMRKWWLLGYSLDVLFLSLVPFPPFPGAARVFHPSCVLLNVSVRRGLALQDSQCQAKADIDL